jgi:hypothetical protein
VNSEPKAFASLSSGLLARKGAARPAMRPQGFGQMGTGGLDDLGWNDMGFEAPKVTLAPIRDADHDAFGDAVPEPALRNPVGGLTPFSPVHVAQAELAERFVRDSQEASEEECDETAEALELEAPLPMTIVPALQPIAAEAPAPVAAPVRAAPPARKAAPRAAASGKAKAAFTLRLDPERHLKLRLACAIGGRSAQQFVTQALDTLLASMPELDAMAKSAPGKLAHKD